MKVRKIAIAALCAGALMVASAPASAAAYLIGGKWYFFSLDFEASLAKVTGKDLKDGTRVFANVTITDSEVQCANPQGHLLDPGEGPQVEASGTSASVTDKDLTRTGNKVTGNIYKTTAQVPLPTDPPPAASPCKDPAGVAQWLPTYWRYKEGYCNRGTTPSALPACYADRAVKINGVLTYVTGGAVPDPVAWTFVFLPTAFSYEATVQIGVEDPSAPAESTTGTCNFPPNNESGAPFPGQPYSLSNPPSGGWAASPVSYVCTGF